MKVNIVGKGRIPVINTLAPAYNQELEKSQVLTILNYRKFRIYCADGSGMITRANINAKFDAAIAAATKAAEPVTPVKEELPSAIAEKLVEPSPATVDTMEVPPVITPDDIIPTGIVEEPDVVPPESVICDDVDEVAEEAPEEETVDEEVSEDETTEETTENPAGEFRSRKKNKNRNRNRNNG